MNPVTDNLTMYTITIGSTLISGILYYLYFSSTKTKVTNQKQKKKAVKKKPFVMPKWAIKKGYTLEPPDMHTEYIKALHQRKPPAIWDNVLFFPGTSPTKPDSPIKQLKYYFQKAKTSIYICMYLCSNYALSDCVREKFDEGLVVEIVSEYDTWTAHNSKGIIQLARHGIPVRLNRNGFMMHNKFAIIDEEAVITGSLNWTRQGVQSNNENVMITVEPRIVQSYIAEFNRLYGSCRTWEEEIGGGGK